MQQGPVAFPRLAIVVAFAVVIVFVVAAAVTTVLMRDHLVAGIAPAAAAALPSPGLVVPRTRQTLIEFDTTEAQRRERARARLASYGWTDRATGMVHIPIERAMQVVAQEGWW